VGASVILLATALGSGELIIWPYITTTVGVGLLWLAAFGFATQYFLKMEIERYTLVTGETAVTGFSRLWKPWGIIFALGAIAFAGAGGASNLVQSNWRPAAVEPVNEVTATMGPSTSASPVAPPAGLQVW
jgi:hypothetical protein